MPSSASGRAASAHLPWLGPAFLVIIPVIGGLIYGPLIYRYAREARGHGVPEVMVAVAENGGRIRPQVTVVKALASALCIGTGGSVGREGPIVQIGSALASSLGQWIRMPEDRLRILVACGAAGGIAATFNAPVTGVFFGVELILRAFSIDALFTVMISAMLADLTARPFLGGGPFLSGFPVGIVLGGRPLCAVVPGRAGGREDGRGQPDHRRRRLRRGVRPLAVRRRHLAHGVPCRTSRSATPCAPSPSPWPPVTATAPTASPPRPRPGCLGR
jgi:hypothetical protein